MAIIPFGYTSPSAPSNQDLRPTDGAGHGLRVKSPVKRVGIFRRTIRTHFEWCHVCVRPVIWNIGNNGKRGPAISAINEWVSGNVELDGFQQFPAGSPSKCSHSGEMGLEKAQPWALSRQFSKPTNPRGSAKREIHGIQTCQGWKSVFRE